MWALSSFPHLCSSVSCICISFLPPSPDLSLPPCLAAGSNRRRIRVPGTLSPCGPQGWKHLSQRNAFATQVGWCRWAVGRVCLCRQVTQTAVTIHKARAMCPSCANKSALLNHPGSRLPCNHKASCSTATPSTREKRANFLQGATQVRK